MSEVDGVVRILFGLVKQIELDKHLRVMIFALPVLVLTGCIKSNWIYQQNSMRPEESSGEDYYKWPEYELSDDDLVIAKQSRFRELAALNDNDWPLMIALAKESQGVGAIDCRATGDPFKCILAASEKRQPAYSYLTRMGTDSVYGWGIAPRADGSLIFFSYDSSPCGQIRPNLGCSFSLTYRICEIKAELQTQKFRRQKVACIKPLISF